MNVIGTLSISIQLLVPTSANLVQRDPYRHMVVFKRDGLERDEAIDLAARFIKLNPRLPIEQVSYVPVPEDIGEEAHTKAKLF